MHSFGGHKIGTEWAGNWHIPSVRPETMRCMDRASLEQLLGDGLSLAEIGRRVDLHEATVGYWVKKHGLQAVNQDKYAARGGLERGAGAACCGGRLDRADRGEG